MGVTKSGIIRTVGSNGQISLGKEYAGKLVWLHEMEPGVFMLKIGEFVPDSERWLMDPSVQQELEEAIQWAEEHDPQDSNLDDIERRIRDAQ
ncbi:hypothetical protein IW967_02755 [Alicyclobacillus mali]|uniref:Uncharacterized protein n=1 Tax=Alicyclobacillus mali (ex Roth et al. 2021) TaxID=1123961 RepID=A0ABS0F0J2_9BACL|nr:hypothetical protein [Alicyclobacillus mali (ex Roth et al. 2021)]MBF8376793.1 hypothetical protein [Alicyclobacillus mali (ex Roth et al. 2021)]